MITPKSKLAALMDHGVLIGDIVDALAPAQSRTRGRTVVFATNVAHSIHIKDEFIKSGVKAEHIDGKTPKDERDEILARLVQWRSRTRQQLHGADRRLGHALCELLRAGTADEIAGPIPANGWPRACDHILARITL